MEDLKFFELEVPAEATNEDNFVQTKFSSNAYVLWAPMSDPYCADKSELA